MTTPGGVGAARGDAPTPQDAAATRFWDVDVWYAGTGWTPWCKGVDRRAGEYELWLARHEGYDARMVPADPVPVAADVPTPSAATQNDEAQR